MKRKNSRLEEIERILDEVAKEQKKFAKEMRQLRAAQIKTDEQMKQTDKKIDRVNKMVGELTGGWGRFVEGMMEPSVLKWVEEDLKLRPKSIMRNLTLYENGEIAAEIDLFIEGRKEDGTSLLVIVEAKSNFRASDMRKFKKLLSNLANYLPTRYKNAAVIVAVAAMSFGNGVKPDALKSGFYIFEPEDSIMKLTKPRQPKIFEV